jgi:hypothetical protein
MGWIRVLAFREQMTWWETGRDQWGKVKRESGDDSRTRELSPKDAAPAPAPQASGKAVAPEAQDNMARGDEQGFPGTGWGDAREDHVRRVQFTPEPVALDRIIFRYEYASGLAALGIDPSRFGWHDRLASRDGEPGFARAPRR